MDEIGDILIVDDDSINLQVLGSILEQSGFRVSGRHCLVILPCATWRTAYRI